MGKQGEGGRCATRGRRCVTRERMIRGRMEKVWENKEKGEGVQQGGRREKVCNNMEKWRKKYGEGRRCEKKGEREN